MASEMRHTPVRSEKGQRVAAWIALGLALIYPLTVVSNTVTIVTWQLGQSGRLVFDSFSSGFLYLVGFAWYILWPVPIVAIFLASLVLRDSRWRNRTAWVTVILGALSILAMVGAVLALTLFAHGQSGSSARL